MVDERLSDHALLHLKKEFVKRIYLARLVDKFNSEHQNKKNSPKLARWSKSLLLQAMFQQKVAKCAFTFIMSIHPSTRLMKIPHVPQTTAKEIKLKKKSNSWTKLSLTLHFRTVCVLHNWLKEFVLYYKQLDQSIAHPCLWLSSTRHMRIPKSIPAISTYSDF
jgi:hypothetical protein